MAHKMKGFPMQDTSSTHGTNANYKKSGPPFNLGGLMDPLGLRKKLFGGGKSNCPPAPPAQAQVGAAKPVEPVTPAAAAAPAAAVVDPNAGVSDQGEAPVPMKRNLKVGAPKMDSPMQKGKTSKMGKLKALGKAINTAWRASATENVGTSLRYAKQDYKKAKKESRDADQINK